VNPSLFERHRGSLPILIDFPHSGTFLPEALRSRLTPAALGLPDTDWFVPELYQDCLRRYDVCWLIATHSRYVVDLNRPADGAALYPGRIESGVCPSETFGGASIYRAGHELRPEETSERVERYWRPYHAALTELRDEMLAQHGQCLIWDAHCIRSHEPRLFDGELPELNLGSWDARSAGPALVEPVVALLRAQQRFSQVVNGRFKGGYITRHYGAPAHRVHALQLEIAQRAYMSETESPRFHPATAAPLSALLGQIIAALVTALV
jgi:N-formylglutamate deformylase